MKTTYNVSGVMTNKGKGAVQAGDLMVEVTKEGKSHLQWFRNVNDIKTT